MNLTPLTGCLLVFTLTSTVLSVTYLCGEFQAAKWEEKVKPLIYSEVLNNSEYSSLKLPEDEKHLEQWYAKHKEFQASNDKKCVGQCCECVLECCCLYEIKNCRPWHQHQKSCPRIKQQQVVGQLVSIFYGSFVGSWWNCDWTTLKIDPIFRLVVLAISCYF
jgi:hypothetical protein